MREKSVAAALLAVVAIVLGALQFFASVALRSQAQRGAWVTLLSPAVAQKIGMVARSLPLPGSLRLAFAREAFAEGDAARAASDLRALPPSAGAFALGAALARARGDTDSAVRSDVAARDYTSLAVDLDTLVASGRLARALDVQRAAVAQLSTERTAPDALAEAEYHLGIYEEARAQTFPIGSAARGAHARAAAAAYARSVALGPLDERYILAAGNQALNLKAWAAAGAAFERARALDPTAAEPLTGLGDLALRRGDVGAARSYLARAQALDASSAAVARLAQKLRR